MFVIFGTGSQLSDDINLGIILSISLLTQYTCEFPENVINVVQCLQCSDYCLPFKSTVVPRCANVNCLNLHARQHSLHYMFNHVLNLS